jgi:hypothetical protein
MVFFKKDQVQLQWSKQFFQFIIEGGIESVSSRGRGQRSLGDQVLDIASM